MKKKFDFSFDFTENLNRLDHFVNHFPRLT